MLLSSLFHRDRSISFEQLLCLQVVATQIVFALEAIPEIVTEERQALAQEQVLTVLDEMDIKAPSLVIDSAINAAFFGLRERKARTRSSQHDWNLARFVECGFTENAA